MIVRKWTLFTPFLFFLFRMIAVRGQIGDGCGYTILRTHSGTLTSLNFPGTYRNNTHCEWQLSAPDGLGFILKFGDFDLEYSPNCTNGSLWIVMAGNNRNTLGPFCGTMHMIQQKMILNSSEVTIRFTSGYHRSGRGFLISYATDRHHDLISCMKRGSHLHEQHFSAYCPAGCGNVSGDVWGMLNPGYRDTSVLCKAAIHAGVISDELGGYISLTRERSLTHYESALANGILSKTGSLSEKRLIINRECTETLPVIHFNASSVWTEVDKLGNYVNWLPENADPGTQGPPWAAESTDKLVQLEIDLGEKKNVTGIITQGSGDGHYFYVTRYKISWSKDRRNWKVYKSSGNKEEKVFEGNTDAEQTVRNNFFPPILTRYLLIQPQKWHDRAALRIHVLGCSALKSRSTRPSVSNGSGVVSTTVTKLDAAPSTDGSFIVKNTDRELSINPEVAAPTERNQDVVSITDGPIIIRNTEESPSLMLILIVVGLVVSLCALALLVWVCRKKRQNGKEFQCPLQRGIKVSNGKSSSFCCENRPHLESELTPYSIERIGPSDYMETPQTVYAEADVIPGGQKASSTFRPTVEDGYTIPMILNHYDTPGKFHEYAEPLMPEPEYATPFSEQFQDSGSGEGKRGTSMIKIAPPCSGTLAGGASNSIAQQYDFPIQRLECVGEQVDYNVPQASGGTARKASVIYAEPQAESQCQRTTDPAEHMYHVLL
ncbi:discoidin, CUB and LCCL domain-containing protein 1 isoform X1 [Polypterus senegalus]|uniref:discoidin, CUB and LCCL domain-containing protein 1 isoform X1 n=1 Tax=Polypterus senegalus TaxID=55291 RepID=UPI0019634667|nr:discoidin, CUB and LCCL domain-containing protein 1 isoform X1 [Polypterus senegalus]XP_039595699.1 discoidin, CUB and LCCL domain-containing protein 1 isoform X1 [Polypterus senegalus]